jgi:hypothetical protein
MNEPWYREFGAPFWLAIGGLIAGAVGVGVKACIKSKCQEVKLMGCFSCMRDTKAEEELEMARIEHGLPPDVERD